VLRQVTQSSGDAIYRYHADGTRASKTWSGSTTHFTYLGDQEIVEYDNAGAITRRYVRLPGAVDKAFLMIDATLPANDRERWAHQNRQGSVVLVTDAAGATIETHTYSPYGDSGDADTGFPFRFTGQKLDPETGLYFYKARYYDPELGRFLETDPVGYADQMNMYGYVGNDPLNGTDPYGEVIVKVYDPDQASVDSHVSVAYVDTDGNVRAVEFTGNGELREYNFGEEGLKVDVDSDGNITPTGVAQLAEAMIPLSDGYNDDGVSNYKATVFSDADDAEGFDNAVETLQGIIADNGGPQKGSPSGNSPAYHLCTNNCGTAANIIAAGAGAQNYGNHWLPNAQYATERSRGKHNSNMWSQSGIGLNHITTGWP